MKTDAALRSEAMKCLVDNFGIVDATRFIALTNRERFDYTKWQRSLWNDISIKELSRRAKEYCDEHEANRL